MRKMKAYYPENSWNENQMCRQTISYRRIPTEYLTVKIPLQPIHAPCQKKKKRVSYYF